MKSNIGDIARIKHIIDAILEIEEYTHEITFIDFFKDSMIQSACIRQLEIIGEAANHISEKLKVESDFIAWREIIGLRNILIHNYFGVDINLIWQIIEEDIPKLKTNIQLILKNQN